MPKSASSRLARAPYRFHFYVGCQSCWSLHLCQTLSLLHWHCGLGLSLFFSLLFSGKNRMCQRDSNKKKTHIYEISNRYHICDATCPQAQAHISSIYIECTKFWIIPSEYHYRIHNIHSDKQVPFPFALNFMSICFSFLLSTFAGNF